MIEIFNSGYSVTIKPNKNDYEYTFVDESNIKHVVNGKHPAEVTNRDKVGKQLLNIVSKCDNYSYATKHNIVVDFRDHKSVNRVIDSMFKDILNELKMYLIKIDEEAEEADRLSILEIQSHYDLLYNNYIKNRDYLGVSDIEYIYSICKHMGVGIEDVILNCYITYLLTLLDIRATNLIAIGGPATGKALALDTKIPTPDGFTTMGDIKVGDEIFDENGNICNVTLKSSIFKNHTCYELTFDDKNKVVADAEHLWTLRFKERKGKFTITTEEMYEAFINKNNHGRSKYMFYIDSQKPLKLPDKDLPIDPYLLGCWLGNGTSATSEITSVDDEIINAFSEKYELRQYDYDKIRYYIDGGFYTLLNENNLLKNKHIPKEYLRASYEQRLALVQGLMDTNGYIREDGSCEFIRKDYKLMVSFKELLSTLGIKTHITKTTKSIKSLNFEGEYYKVNFTTTLPIFRLDRKLCRIKKEIKNTNIFQRRIIDIKKVPTVETQCIQVDSPNHLYLCSDFIPTHNTKSTKEALRFVPDKWKHIGTYTESYFFNKFNGQDLSRHIFYMGDLGGGEIDDEKTIITRNIFKELISDGYINRGLNLDGEVVEQFVTGKPAIVYTTVTEEIINEQEKSRSNIVKPTEPDKKELMLYSVLNSTPGIKANNLNYIDKCVESVKGFSNHLIEEINHYEFFNPYAFIVCDFFISMNEYNRKIDEFNNMLNVISLLNNPYTLKHNYYIDDNGNNIETNLVIIKWEDIINTMSLFNSNNLLPTEKELLIELCKNYSPYDDDFIGSLKEYEEYVSEELIDESGIIRYVGIQNEDKDCFFTVKSVKKDLNNSNAVKHYNRNLSDKLRLFYEHNYLIKVGNTENGINIYGLSFDIRDRIYNNVPTFDEKSIKPLEDYFKKSYPDLFYKYLEFIKNDNTEISKPTFKNDTINILDGFSGDGIHE